MQDSPQNETSPKKTHVGVVTGKGAYENVRAAMASLDLSFVAGRSVLVKPNAGRPVPPRSGINTSPEAVAGCIDALKDAGAAVVSVGESPILGVQALDAFETCGIAEVARERGIELVDLDHDRPRRLKLPEGAILPHVRVCRRVLEHDVVVSLAVMKTHMHTGVSLGLKNVKGMLYRRQKVEFHQLSGDGFSDDVRPLDRAIADLLTALKPHIGVIDGSIGLEGLGPSAGTPKQADVAVASLDAVAADAVACRIMGIDPFEVPHLKLCVDKGVGVANSDLIRIIPSRNAAFSCAFERPPTELSMVFPDVTLYEAGACSACLSTTLLFLQRFKHRIEKYKLEDGQLHIVLGKDTKEVPSGSIVIGNCAAKHKKKGAYAKGCPPVASAIYKAVTGKDPDEPAL